MLKKLNEINLVANAYVQMSFRAKKAAYLLGNDGIEDLQLWINVDLSELKQQPVDARPSNSLNTQRMDNYEEKLGFGRKNKLETNLVIAMLVATVTFAAAFAMPGGYNSQGLATLSAKPAFKAFVIFDTIGFLFSVTAVTIQFDTCGIYSDQIRYMSVATICTRIAMLGMVLAFVSAMHVVLEKSVGLAITASVTVGGIALSFTAVGFVEPNPNIFEFMPFFKRSRRYVRRFLFHYF